MRPLTGADDTQAKPAKYLCPCCGYYTFPVPANRDHGFICPVCFWENDGFVRSAINPSVCNHRIALQKARANFKEYGACEYESLQHVRLPEEDELSGLDDGVDF
ncbi:hypothetical protein E0W00_09380 [Salmonella enterica subsp. enterica serovar Llandoff]|nr:hypothetical protein [Salmonella enterica subsp. enterica serovar Llandoff]